MSLIHAHKARISSAAFPSASNSVTALPVVTARANARRSVISPERSAGQASSASRVSPDPRRTERAGRQDERSRAPAAVSDPHGGRDRSEVKRGRPNCNQDQLRPTGYLAGRRGGMGRGVHHGQGDALAFGRSAPRPARRPAPWRRSAFQLPARSPMRSLSCGSASMTQPARRSPRPPRQYEPKAWFSRPALLAQKTQ